MKYEKLSGALLKTLNKTLFKTCSKPYFNRWALHTQCDGLSYSTTTHHSSMGRALTTTRVSPTSTPRARVQNPTFKLKFALTQRCLSKTAQAHGFAAQASAGTASQRAAAGREQQEERPRAATKRIRREITKLQRSCCAHDMTYVTS